MSVTDGHAYPPENWTIRGLTETFEKSSGAFPIPTYDDVEVWQTLQTDPLTRPVVEEIRATASDVREEAIPTLTPTRYRSWERNGEKNAYHDRVRDRWRRLSMLTLAECFERDGEYLDAILDHAWRICEQTTWLFPWELSETQNSSGLPVAVPTEEYAIGLASSGTAHVLAEVEYVLGDCLHPALCERIRTEVDRRLLEPYDQRDDFSWMHPPTSNWNAICNGRAGIVALYVEDDPERLAHIIHKAATSLRHYLNDFDADGCSAEGIGYWNFGLRHYVEFAANLEAYTDDEYSLVSPQVVREIAQYPIRIELSPERYPAFSDSNERSSPSPYLTSWLGERLDIPELAARGRRAFENHHPVGTLPETIRNLLWCRQVSPSFEPSARSLREFLSGYDWWLARHDTADPNSLILAAKGGHNDEPHNHNDCGSFVVHRNRESTLTDLGKPATYGGTYFGDQRYQHIETRSFGHSVPYVNGCEQEPGREHAATVIERTETDEHDTLELELGECYGDDAGLESLRRSFELDRTVAGGRVFLTDRARFENDAPRTTLESVLIAVVPMEARDGEVHVAGERTTTTITPDSTVADPSISVERLEDAITVEAGQSDEETRDVWRARIRSENAMAEDEVSIPLEITTRVTESARKH